MKCKICGRELAKNGIKKGVQYYYCTHCRKSYSGEPYKPKRNLFEEYTARLLYRESVKRQNKITKTVWTINQIARLMERPHRYIREWATRPIPSDINKKQLLYYIKTRANGGDILYALGYNPDEQMSENLSRIVYRKPKIKNEYYGGIYLSVCDYLKLINMPINNRKQAIFVLGALLGCRTSEIIGAKYSDVDYDKKTIFFHRVVSYGKNTIVSETSKMVSYRTYPLTERMLSIIDWLKTDALRRDAVVTQRQFYDFICTDESGQFITSHDLNERIEDIYDNLSEIDFEAKFRQLRLTVRNLMLQAGVSPKDVKLIFGYRTTYSNLNKDEKLYIMRNAYKILDKYITEKLNEMNGDNTQ